jgi:hypothetical protein
VLVTNDETVLKLRSQVPAFAPDASALLVESGPRVLRVDLASGALSTVLRATRANDWPIAAWGASGNVAASLDGRGIRVFGPSPADERLPGAFVDRMRWSPDGGALAYLYTVPSVQRCAVEQEGMGLLIPGAAPRTLLAPTDADLVGAMWSPDGGRLAVQADDRGCDAAPERRGKRHPWPRRIRHDYEMLSARGNAAVRHLVVRVARALRHGASRDKAMQIVCTEHARILRRFPEIEDTVVAEALAVELSKWLRSAGWRGIDGLDEFDC